MYSLAGCRGALFLRPLIPSHRRRNRRKNRKLPPFQSQRSANPSKKLPPRKKTALPNQNPDPNPDPDPTRFR